MPQRQVMIEVTIAEVTLTDELQFGVEWLFKGGAPSGRGCGGFVRSRRLDAVQPGRCRCRQRGGRASGCGAARRASPTSSTTRTSPAASRRCCNLLDTYGNTKVVANPHIAALDNQKATIKAGDRIPINQQTHRRRHDQRGDDDVAVHRHRRAAAGDAAHQRRRPGHARRAGRGQHPGHADATPATRRRSTRARCRRSSPCRRGQTMVMGGLIRDTKAQHVRRACRCSSRIPDPRRPLRQPGR